MLRGPWWDVVFTLRLAFPVILCSSLSRGDFAGMHARAGTATRAGRVRGRTPESFGRSPVTVCRFWSHPTTGTPRVGHDVPIPMR
jgi:hypothetical protein